MSTDAIASSIKKFRVFGLDHRWVLGFFCLFLCGVGLVSNYAYVNGFGRLWRYEDVYSVLGKQSRSILVGVCIMIGLMTIKTHWLNRRAAVLYCFSLLLLILPFTGFGCKIGCIRRWFIFGNLLFSSGPWAVLFATPFLLQLAFRVMKNGFRRQDTIWVVLAMIPVNYILVIMQKDIQMALLLNLIVGLTFLFNTEDHAISKKHSVPTTAIFMIPFIVMLCGFLIYHPDVLPKAISIFLYRQDPYGIGYQTMIAIKDIKAGGWLGNGLSAYTEPAASGIHYIPVTTQTRFIFQIIGRLFGYAGISIVAGSFAIVFYIFFRYIKTIASSAKRNLTLAMSLLIAIPTTLGFIRTLNLLPLIPSFDIPFLGYSRDCLLVSAFALGVIFDNSVRARQEI